MNGFYNRETPRPPSYLVCCHTAPNERLLQHISPRRMGCSLHVVIPLQMNGFYNRETPRPPSYLVCCHTAPNERLLQHISPRRMGCSLHVVIPLQMNGFYNGNNNFNFQLQLVVIPLQMNGFYNDPETQTGAVCKSCHTAPNERLLQPRLWSNAHVDTSCHTAPNERLQ